MRIFIPLFIGAFFMALVLSFTPVVDRGQIALPLLHECEKELPRNQTCVLVAQPKQD